MKNWRYWSTAVLLLLVGCSPNVKITGTVSFSDDGAPVPSGTVYFVADDRLARGNIQNGTFVMGSKKADDGLPPGNYSIYFSGVEEVVREGEANDAGESTEPIYAPTIDLKYLSAESSGLTQTVDKTTKTIDFQLDRNPNFPK